jgi:hypothetical protein
MAIYGEAKKGSEAAISSVILYFNIHTNAIHKKMAITSQLLPFV